MNYKQLFRLPFDVLKRITSHIIKEINEYRYPYKKRYKELIANYKLCGLDQNREIYLSYLNSLLKELGFPLYVNPMECILNILLFLLLLPLQILK